MVLNKTDMLDDAKREELTAIVASLNPLATVIPCTQGQVRRGHSVGKASYASVRTRAGP